MDITFEGLKTACLVLLGLAGALVSVDKAISAWKHLFGGDGEKFAKVKAKLDNDNDRIKDVERTVGNHTEELASIRKDNKQMLMAINALLQHEITGNSIERLKSTKASLDLYLIENK